MCKTTDIFFGHFRLFHGREKQFSIFLDFYVENPSFQRPLNYPTMHNEVKKQFPPPSADALTFLIARQPATRDDDVNDLRTGCGMRGGRGQEENTSNNCGGNLFGGKTLAADRPIGKCQLGK